MSIIKCKECANDISDKAAACPKCGAPVEKQKPQEEPKKVYEPKPSYTAPMQEQRSSSKSIWWIVGVAIVIIAAIIVYNNPNSIPGVKIQINTPKPIIATQRADNADASVFNYKATVYATISNQGGEGNVLVTFHMTQGGRTTNKTLPIYMQAGQNMDVKQIFDEVTRLGGEMKYSVDAVAR